ARYRHTCLAPRGRQLRRDHRGAAGIEDLLPGGNRLPPGVHRSLAARPTGRGAAADRLRRLPREPPQRAAAVMRRLLVTGGAGFLRTNVLGTQALLEAARDGWGAGAAERGCRFHHVSTDEVYGSLDPGVAAFTEASPYAPSSPYAASKAAADHLARAFGRTYGLP